MTRAVLVMIAVFVLSGCRLLGIWGFACVNDGDCGAELVCTDSGCEPGERDVLPADAGDPGDFDPRFINDIDAVQFSTEELKLECDAEVDLQDDQICGIEVSVQTFDAGGILVDVIARSSIELLTGANVRFTGPRPVILLAAGDVEINEGAALSVASIGAGHGAGAQLETNCRGQPGEAGAQTGAVPGVGSGGGGGGSATPGGAGGDSGENHVGAVGGVSGDQLALKPGCNGGEGGGGGDGGIGGLGGGALQISAAGTIINNGTLLAGGSAGGASHFGGGGGGGGGTIILEADALQINGGIFLNGGGGGGGGGGVDVFPQGFAGQDSGATATPAAGGNAHAAGGAGGAGAGGGAVFLPATPGAAADSSSTGSGGGGGGGQGTLVLFSKGDCETPGELSARVTRENECE